MRALFLACGQPPSSSSLSHTAEREGREDSLDWIVSPQPRIHYVEFLISIVTVFGDEAHEEVIGLNEVIISFNLSPSLSLSHYLSISSPLLLTPHSLYDLSYSLSASDFFYCWVIYFMSHTDIKYLFNWIVHCLGKALHFLASSQPGQVEELQCRCYLIDLLKNTFSSVKLSTTVSKKKKKRIITGIHWRFIMNQTLFQVL